MDLHLNFNPDRLLLFLSDKKIFLKKVAIKGLTEMETEKFSTVVIGAGTSGVEIAIELAKNRKVLLSGKPTPHIPDFIFQYAGRPYWWFAHHMLTLKTPIGRKVSQKIRSSGGPLISVSIYDVLKANVEHVPRMKGIQNGLPLLENDRVVSVNSIVWATGFKPDFSWIKPDLKYENGWPLIRRGVSEDTKGLYFIGMLFQFGLTSGLVSGMGRDAAFVVNHLHQAKKFKPETAGTLV